MTISVCIGSACHKRGSYGILNRLKELVKENGVEDRVSITPAFCIGECQSGVNMKIDEKLFVGVTLENVENIFQQQVLAKLN